MTPGQDIKYQRTVLKNGLRVVTEKIPAIRSVAFGIWINVGSGDEETNENGMSHFIEHMLFKGTGRRSAKVIAGSLESLGGSLNAFTSREQTCYYAHILDEHLPQAIDVLSDILMNSTFNKINIEREKLVITEEIREINENPSDHIHELFAYSFWRGQPLGRPIMGSIDSVHSFTRRNLKKFMRNRYLAGDIVIAAAGNVSHRKLVRLLREKLEFTPGRINGRPTTSVPSGTSMKYFKNDSNQVHTCIGFPGLGFNHPDKLKFLALHTYLGGGMSSMLFQKVREEKGLAYTIYTFPDMYRANGLFGAYMATDVKQLHVAVETVLKEFRKIKKYKISADRLDKIKAQFKGGMLLGMESSYARMNRLARMESLGKGYIPTADVIKDIDRIKPNDLIEVARKVLNFDNMTITALGSSTKGEFDKVDWAP